MLVVYIILAVLIYAMIAFTIYFYGKTNWRWNASQNAGDFFTPALWAVVLVFWGPMWWFPKKVVDVINNKRNIRIAKRAGKAEKKKPIDVSRLDVITSKQYRHLKPLVIKYEETLPVSERE